LLVASVTRSDVRLEESSFVEEARSWIKSQLGPGIWETLAEEVSKRLFGRNCLIEFEEIEAIAQATNASPEDVHAVLTSLASRPKALVKREFYRWDGRRRIEVPLEEVSRHLDKREHSPSEWRDWAQQVGVAWKRKVDQ